ncbi:uncharacterized protein JNUCC1_00061 [Lentibacillus sp. JNUCC-1]|uniref:YlaI family protein n=1 Tax=Lentibacillus sp. JNUCC-1 TaxID=2654513 RepID=UPI0012E7B8C6|nr:YlaI family protein [Lentibacillus sp. JNUCC-1]MUV36260.1 uncharacterized protein [Lentibacillus sp. JNUCC-1]
MQVKCVICDKVESLQDDCLKAKRLRNRRINMYMCQTCHDRIEENTKKRHNTGNFHLYDPKKKQDNYI